MAKKEQTFLKDDERKIIFIDMYRNKYKLSNMCAALDISYKYRNTDDLIIWII